MTVDVRPESLPPCNLEAEQALLGAALIEAGVVRRIAAIVEPDDFYDQQHAEIYRAMWSLHHRGAPLDFLTLLDELTRTGSVEKAGGIGTITGLVGAVITSIHAEYHAEIIARCATMRRMISAGGKIATIGFQNRLDVDAAYERAERMLRAVLRNRARGTMKPLSEVLTGYMDVLAQASQTPTAGVGCPTGYGDLDQICGGGFQRSDLIILAARPSMGKTGLAVGMMLNAAIRYAATCAMFSLEMSAAQIVARMLAVESGLNGEELRAGIISDARRLGSALGLLGDADIWIDDRPSLSIGKIRDTAIRLHEQRPLDLIVVDHMQLVTIDGHRGNRTNEMTEISRLLKALARDLGVPVLALSQLNRATEHRTAKVPILSDLRESGSIEQDADVVAMIHRPDYYDQESERRGLADVHIAKHRGGRTGVVTMLFDKRTTRFYDLGITRTS